MKNIVVHLIENQYFLFLLGFSLTTLPVLGIMKIHSKK